MRFIPWLTIALASMAWIAGCAKPRPILSIQCKPGFIKLELVQQFEEAYNCQVEIHPLESCESVFRAAQSATIDHDLLIVGNRVAIRLKNEQLLQPVQRDKIPNLNNIDRSFLSQSLDPSMSYSVPFLVRVTGIGYLQNRIQRLEKSWSMLQRPELAGRIGLSGDMRETIGAALKHLGYGINTVQDAELQEARDIVIEWEKQASDLEPKAYAAGLVSEELLLVLGDNQTLAQAMMQNENVAFFVPREGASLTSDDFCIPSTSTQIELAHKFIYYMLDPDISAENMDYAQTLTPNVPAYELLGEELKGNPAVFISPEVLATCEVIRGLGEHRLKHENIWKEVTGRL